MVTAICIILIKLLKFKNRPYLFQIPIYLISENIWITSAVVLVRKHGRKQVQFLMLWGFEKVYDLKPGLGLSLFLI